MPNYNRYVRTAGAVSVLILLLLLLLRPLLLATIVRHCTPATRDVRHTLVLSVNIIFISNERTLLHTPWGTFAFVRLIIPLFATTGMHEAADPRQLAAANRHL